MLIRHNDYLDRKNERQAERRARFLKALDIKDPGHDSLNPAFPLPNMRETTESEIWGHRASYGAASVEAYVGSVKHEGEWGTLLIYFIDHSRWDSGGHAVLVGNGYPVKKVRYFTWTACEHDFVSKNIGNCLNRYTCKKCGSSHDVDSSG